MMRPAAGAPAALCAARKSHSASLQQFTDRFHQLPHQMHVDERIADRLVDDHRQFVDGQRQTGDGFRLRRLNEKSDN